MSKRLVVQRPDDGVCEIFGLQDGPELCSYTFDKYEGEFDPVRVSKRYILYRRRAVVDPVGEPHGTDGTVTGTVTKD